MEIEDRPDRSFRVHQDSYTKRTQSLTPDCTFSSFRSKRQELAWPIHTRLVLACTGRIVVQVSEKSFCAQDAISVNKVMSAAKRDHHRALIQQKLDLKTVKVVAYTDAPFSTNLDHISQLGFLVLQSDASGKCNILHYSSSISKRVGFSVLGSEIYALIHWFDFVYCVERDLETMSSKHVPMELLTDSKCLCDVITRWSSCREKRLMIDIAVVKEAYSRQEISQVGHLFSNQNPADGLAKFRNCLDFNSILDRGSLELDVIQWVLREKNDSMQ